MHAKSLQRSANQKQHVEHVGKSDGVMDGIDMLALFYELLAGVEDSWELE